MKRNYLAMVIFISTLLVILLAVTSAPADAKWPAEPGKSLKRDGNLRVDVANISEGYFYASLQSKSKHRMKMRVAKGDTTLSYDIKNDGSYELFPLQLGNGKYTITLYENVSGKKYSSAGKITLNVNLSSPDICFYYPNQYVNYTKSSDPVKTAAKLCDGKSRKDAYKAITNYMSKNFVYDFLKAVNIKAGMLPDIDDSFSKKMGVCQDLSAICICMMRTQGIPAKLMIGYADKNYHAWVEAEFDGKSYFFDPTVAVNGVSKVKEYTLERYY